MAKTWDKVIEDAFHCSVHYTRTANYTPCKPPAPKILKIPIDGEKELEIPICCWELFPIDSCSCGYKKFGDVYQKSYYATSESQIKDIIGSTRELVKVGYEDIIYYACGGTILDKDLSPVMLCTWKVQRKDSGDLEFIKPVLRILPRCFANSQDKVIKVIVNKIFKTAITTKVSYYSSQDPMDIEVIIGEMPFDIKTIEEPNVFTTTQELLDFAYNNVDKILWSAV